MRGRWAAGIVPRNFCWIIEGRLAVSERPGGYAPHHRRVRRQEEIIWLVAQHFDRVVSLLPSTHNLHAYEERNLPAAHFPLPAQADVSSTLGELYPALLGWLRDGERLLVHQEELGERVAGVIAGFLCWSGALPDPPRAISVVEQILKRQLGAAGRAVVAASIELPPPVAAEATLAPELDAALRVEVAAEPPELSVLEGGGSEGAASSPAPPRARAKGSAPRRK